MLLFKRLNNNSKNYKTIYCSKKKKILDFEKKQVCLNSGQKMDRILSDSPKKIIPDNYIIINYKKHNLLLDDLQNYQMRYLTLPKD